jgi:hypothetical protein
MGHTSKSANQIKSESFPTSPAESEAETPGSDHPGVGSEETDRLLPGSDHAAPGTSEEQEPVQDVH